MANMRIIPSEPDIPPILQLLRDSAEERLARLRAVSTEGMDRESMERWRRVIATQAERLRRLEEAI